MAKIACVNVVEINGQSYYFFTDTGGSNSKLMFGSHRTSPKKTLTYGVAHAKVFGDSNAEAFFLK